MGPRTGIPRRPIQNPPVISRPTPDLRYPLFPRRLGIRSPPEPRELAREALVIVIHAPVLGPARCTVTLPRLTPWPHAATWPGPPSSVLPSSDPVRRRRALWEYYMRHAAARAA